MGSYRSENMSICLVFYVESAEAFGLRACRDFRFPVPLSCRTSPQGRVYPPLIPSLRLQLGQLLAGQRSLIDLGGSQKPCKRVLKGPWGVPEPKKSSQDASKTQKVTQDVAKCSQDGPKMCQDGPKMVSRRPRRLLKSKNPIKTSVF